MRGVLQRIVGPVHSAFFDRPYFAADGDHRIDEAIELRLGFAFGGLDHERARDRKAHRRRVEAIVDQTFRDILDPDISRLLQRPKIENAFVRHPSSGTGIEHWIMCRKTSGHIVCRENGRFGCCFEAIAAHHCDVHPRNRKNPRAAVRRCGHSADSIGSIVAASTEIAMTRQESGEMRADRDRAHAGSAPSMWNAKGLVQIEV